MVHHRPFDISKAGEDLKTISKLPVVALCEMEGLEAWNKKRPIEHIVNFLKSWVWNGSKMFIIFKKPLSASDGVMPV
jgi:hypothetical protein